MTDRRRHTGVGNQGRTWKYQGKTVAAKQMGPIVKLRCGYISSLICWFVHLFFWPSKWGPSESDTSSQSDYWQTSLGKMPRRDVGVRPEPYRPGRCRHKAQKKSAQIPMGRTRVCSLTSAKMAWMTAVAKMACETKAMCPTPPFFFFFGRANGAHMVHIPHRFCWRYSYLELEPGRHGLCKAIRTAKASTQVLRSAWPEWPNHHQQA